MSAKSLLRGNSPLVLPHLPIEEAARRFSMWIFFVIPPLRRSLNIDHEDHRLPQLYQLRAVQTPDDVLDVRFRFGLALPNFWDLVDSGAVRTELREH